MKFSIGKRVRKVAYPDDTYIVKFTREDKEKHKLLLNNNFDYLIQKDWDNQKKVEVKDAPLELVWEGDIKII